MTTSHLSPAARLRAAADRAAGGRVIVSVDDLRAVLDAPPPGGGPGARHVRLADTPADAERLAVAAWDSSSDRRGKYGLHREQSAQRRAELLGYARETIRHLLGQGDT